MCAYLRRLRYYKKLPEWKWQKTEFWYSLNDEELDELCTQTPFWVVVTKVWWVLKFGKNLSAQSPRSGPRWQIFAKLQHSPNLSDHDSKQCWVENESNSFIVELVLKWVFCHFHEGCFVYIYKNESDKYKTIVFNIFLALNRITIVSTMETIVSWVSFQKGLCNYFAFLHYFHWFWTMF